MSCSILSTVNGPNDLEREGEGSLTPAALPANPRPASLRKHWPIRPGPGPVVIQPTLTNASQASSSPVMLAETTPLIRWMYSHSQSTPPWYNTQSHTPTLPNSNLQLTTTSKFGPGLTNVISHTLEIAFKSIPAVLLGSLLNILDGVSYGMIMFPGTGVFSELGPVGVSMFFLSTMLAQLAFTFGGSGFAGANGSMMIEVMPFFHILATDIQSQIGESNAKEVIATTLAAFILSSFLTGTFHLSSLSCLKHGSTEPILSPNVGLTFLLLGALKLGALMDFFPRHILIGCIGGVGVFLILTGFTVSMRIDDDNFKVDWRTFEMMFLDMRNLVLWAVPLVLAVLLRVVTSRWNHQLILPIYFLIIPVLFYIVVAVLDVDLSDLRNAGWIFDMGSAESEAWYKLYSYLDFRAIRFGVLCGTLPTQFALLFFNVLHPPLNVPALSVSLDQDIDTDKELVGHGYSNLLSALFGTVPNYLVYVNTLLFHRVGGGTRIAGFLLAVMTAVLLVIGTAPIAYIPVMVVGALVFVLGIDLVKEALWDTRKQTTRTEYITIVGIIVVMTVWDFVTGVLCGIIASCFFFVVENSQRRSVRSLHTGETATSTVRRPSPQRAYIREVSKRTTILRLQGFLFFGTISHVEDTIRKIVDGPRWKNNPISFLILDLTLVAGVDMSSSGAFVRMHRSLSAKAVTMVFCGCSADSAVAKALESVHVLGADNVKHFLTFNDAMEWTENAYLRASNMPQRYEVTPTAFVLPGRHTRAYDRSGTVPDEDYRIADSEEHPGEPLNALIKVFSSYGEFDLDLFQPMSKYLEHLSLPEDYVLWKQGDHPDGLYIIESGVLRASYKFADHIQHVEESMVPGTLAGELSALSALPRNATVVVERSATLWKLSTESLARLEVEEPKLAMHFLRLVLKAAKIDSDTLLSALASRQ